MLSQLGLDHFLTLVQFWKCLLHWAQAKENIFSMHYAWFYAKLSSLLKRWTSTSNLFHIKLHFPIEPKNYAICLTDDPISLVNQLYIIIQICGIHYVPELTKSFFPWYRTTIKLSSVQVMGLFCSQTPKSSRISCLDDKKTVNGSRWKYFHGWQNWNWSRMLEARRMLWHILGAVYVQQNHFWKVWKHSCLPTRHFAS